MICAIYETASGKVIGWRELKGDTLNQLTQSLTPLGRSAVEAPARIDGPCEVVSGQVVPLSVDQAFIDARQARMQRNHLLAASDWTQVVDAPVNQSAWAAYRQALRDVPDQAGFPNNITWPEPPA